MVYHDGDGSQNEKASEGFVYDGYRFVSAINHETSGGTEFAGFDYGYDAMGNPLWEERSHESSHGNLYVYDAAYRLKTAYLGSHDPSGGDTTNYDKKIEYNLDDVSDRTSVVTTVSGQSETETYTSNSVNW